MSLWILHGFHIPYKFLEVSTSKPILTKNVKSKIDLSGEKTPSPLLMCRTVNKISSIIMYTYILNVDLQEYIC